MDAFNDPLVEEVVVMSSAQVGKTEILNNVVGYFIDQDPSPMLIVQPNVTPMAEAWSKDRLAPMIRDTGALRDKVKDPKARDTGNTILHKNFPGGHITIAGANSPAGLASRPVRIVLCDEVDRYESSAGAEGDPVSLAFKRTANFWNRKKALFSTPTIKGISRIEAAFADSDQRRFAVPCPICGEFQFLSWSQVKWPEGKPDAAKYQCLHCGQYWDDAQRWKAIARGKWESTAPFTGVAGFHLNAIYSPWTTLKELADSWYKSLHSPEMQKTFVNTALGELWEERHDIKIPASDLLDRCEDFGSDVPKEVAVITAGVDVQADRLVAEIVGWGADEESWSLAHAVIPGDVSRTEVWRDLDDLLRQTFPHASGLQFRIRAACIDSGYKDAMVLRFTRDKYNRRVFATKGRAGDLAIWPRKPSRKNQTPFFIVGVDHAKESIYDRLKLDEPGPGYCHFPRGRDLEYFEELTAEKKYTTYKHGFPKREWRKDPGARNEGLDCRVLAYAALHALYYAGLRLNDESSRMAAMKAETAKPKQTPDAIDSNLELRRNQSYFGQRTQNWFNR